MTSTTSLLPLYRIGAVSKTSGVPVSTLRIWESRYHAFAPVKTEGNQRLYSEHDVSKALLLKQLSGVGHGMASVASLDMESLRRLCAHAQLPAPTPETAGSSGLPISVAVVDVGLANRIESHKFTSALRHTRFRVTIVLDDLTAAHDTSWPETPQVLLIKVNSLQYPVFESVQALIQKHPVAHTIVLYHFAPDVVVQTMRFSGITVRRDPLSDIELGELLQSVILSQPHLGTGSAVGMGITPTRQRKYSDRTLRRMAGISTNVLCECPRHVAELIAQLVSFEAYSQECLNKSTDDANLHAYLRVISGSARTLFETALEKIAEHEGISLDEDAK